MIKFFKMLALMMIVFVTSCKQIAQQEISELEKKNKSLQEEIDRIKAQEAADEALGQYVINMVYMTESGRKKSDAWKLSFAQDFVKVANDVFVVKPEPDENGVVLTEQDVLLQKHAFAGVLAIESAFNKLAQSPTGPKGYAQLAKKSFHEAMSMCGLNAVDDDVWETKLNLYAGACYFKMILELPKIKKSNDVIGAMIGYNQGINSKDFKDYLRGGMTSGLEPLRYVSKANFLLKRNTDDKVPGIPLLKDIQTPSIKPTSKPAPVSVAKEKTDLKATTPSDKVGDGKKEGGTDDDTKIQTDGMRVP